MGKNSPQIYKQITEEILALLASKGLSVAEARDISWLAHDRIASLRDPVVAQLEQIPLAEALNRRT